MQHILGSCRRLAAYALEPATDPEALAAEARGDWTPQGGARDQLWQTLQQQFAELTRQIEQLSEAALDAVCFVGRRRVPVRRAIILHHLIEHAAHHSGQLILLVRLYAQRPTERLAMQLGWLLFVGYSSRQEENTRICCFCCSRSGRV